MWTQLSLVLFSLSLSQIKKLLEFFTTTFLKYFTCLSKCQIRIGSKKKTEPNFIWLNEIFFYFIFIHRDSLAIKNKLSVTSSSSNNNNNNNSNQIQTTRNLAINAPTTRAHSFRSAHFFFALTHITNPKNSVRAYLYVVWFNRSKAAPATGTSSLEVKSFRDNKQNNIKHRNFLI